MLVLNSLADVLKEIKPVVQGWVRWDLVLRLWDARTEQATAQQAASIWKQVGRQRPRTDLTLSQSPEASSLPRHSGFAAASKHYGADALSTVRPDR